MNGRIGKGARPKKTGKRSCKNQERKQRHDSGKCNVACQRPTIIGEEMPHVSTTTRRRKRFSLRIDDFCPLTVQIARRWGICEVFSYNRLIKHPENMARSRTILITGCSSGIGAHCARALKADGWTVFATARQPIGYRNAESRWTLRPLSGLSANRIDLPRLSKQFCSETGGTLDALFNNGAYALPGAVEDLPIAGLREQFDAISSVGMS